MNVQTVGRVITRGMSLHDNNDSLLSGDDDNALQDGSAGRTEDEELTDTDKSDSNNDDISNTVQQFRNIDMADIEDMTIRHRLGQIQLQDLSGTRKKIPD